MNKKPFPPGFPSVPPDFGEMSGIPQRGVPLIGITPEDFFRCPVCKGEMVWIPCGRILRFEPVSIQEIKIQLLFKVINLGGGNSIEMHTEQMLMCIGDCKRPYKVQELAAIVLDQKKTQEKDPSSS